MAGVFSIGDAVTFVNEKQDGKVVGFKPNNIIVVEIEDGFSFDVSASEIVLLKSSMNKAMGLADANSQKEIDKPKIDTFHPLPNFVKLIDESQIELIVIPEQGATLTGKIDFFIANPIAALFQGVMYEKSKNKLKKKTSFTVDQGGQLFIAQYTRDQLIAIDSFVLAFTLSQDESYLSTHKEIQLNYPGLIQNFPSLVAPYCFATSHLIIKKNNTNEEIDLSGLKDKFQATTNVKISQPHQQKVAGSKDGNYLRKYGLSSVNSEVDLHIESLIEFPEGYSNSELMRIQLNHFRSELDKALVARMSSIVFIHGVGNGVLKEAIEIELKEMNLNYRRADFSKYGIGATEVLIA